MNTPPALPVPPAPPTPPATPGGPPERLSLEKPQAPKKYIRTFEGDMEAFKKGWTPNLTPLKEPPPAAPIQPPPPVQLPIPKPTPVPPPVRPPAPVRFPE